MSGEEIGEPLMKNKKTMKIKSYEENLNQDENQEEISWETMMRYDKLWWRPRKLWRGKQLRNQVEKPEGKTRRRCLKEPWWETMLRYEDLWRTRNYEDETLRRGKLLRNQYEKLGDVLRNHADNPWWETMMRYEELWWRTRKVWRLMSMKRKTGEEPGWKTRRRCPEEPWWDRWGTLKNKKQENYEDLSTMNYYLKRFFIYKRGKLSNNQDEKPEDVLRNHKDNPWWETLIWGRFVELWRRMRN